MRTRVLNRIFHILFLVGYLWVFLNALFRTTDNFIIGIIGGGVGFAIMLWAYKIILRQEQAKCRKISIFLFVFMIIVQMLVGYLLEVEFQWDYGKLNRDAMLLVSGQDISTEYYARYPNNLLMFSLLRGIYSIEYSLMGGTFPPFYVSIIINILIFDTGIFMLSRLAKALWDEQRALYIMIICFLFLPYYLYMPCVYTDTFSFPFIIAALLFLHRSFEEKRSKLNKVCSTIGAGICLGIGFKLKGTLIVILIAILVFYFMKCNLKMMVHRMVVFLFGVALLVGISNLVLSNVGIVTEKELERYEFPATHWIMMGLGGIGGYSQQMVDYTISSGDYEEKKEASIRKIKEQLADYGVTGLMEHLTDKATYRIWGDGTYAAGDYATRGPVRRNILHEFLSTDGKYYNYYLYYSQCFHIALLLGVLLSIYKGVSKAKITWSDLFEIILFGMTLFLLIWESNSRYLLSFSPFIFMVAINGMDNYKNIELRVLKNYFIKDNYTDILKES